MKNFKSTYVCVLLILSIALGCATSDIKKDGALASTQYDPLLGEKHNSMVKTILAEVNISKNNSYIDNINNVNKYFIKAHNIDVSEVPVKLFILKTNNPAARATINDFDPYAFIDKYQSNYSVSFASTLKKVISEIENSKQDSSEIKEVITRYISNAKSNKFKLTEGETNAFLNTLTVIYSSTSLWYSKIAEPNSTGRYELYNAKSDAWKVAVSDGIGGLAGSLGGPGGALVGMVAGSLDSWISML